MKRLFKGEAYRPTGYGIITEVLFCSVFFVFLVFLVYRVLQMDDFRKFNSLK
ncbi:MAG: hypothetical protein LBJ00_05505 [Planctomycetaceae bacterium]|nr:hypothetical protein [Planctomycetaceae bacterium]